MVSQVRVFSLFLPQSNSLKTKRRVILSLIDRLKHRFNASIIEVEGNDVWQRADIGVAICANNRTLVEQEFDALCRYVEMNAGEALLTGVEKVGEG